MVCVGVMGLAWWLMLALSLLANGCCGYWEEERIGLLELKASINHPFLPNLLSWVDSVGRNSTTNCCEWEGVVCNATTRRVVELSLSHINDRWLGDWYLNASTFLAFQSLRSLDLSANSIVGCIEKEGFDKLSRLSNLEFLDLTFNNLDNSILSSLNELSSLKTLNLNFNKLNGSIRLAEDMAGMISLKELNLGSNSLCSIITASQGLETVSWLKNLEILDISENNFNNSIISTLNWLSSLKTLRLCNTGLSGSLVMQDFEGLTNLKELDLSDNNLSSILISHQGFENISQLRNLEALDLYGNSINDILSFRMIDFPSLKTLNLSHNNIDGSLYNQKGLGNESRLKSLEYLDISYGVLGDNILSFFSGLSSLKTLILVGGKIKASVRKQSLHKLWMSNLEVLDLRLSELNNDTSFLLGFSSLKELYLSGSTSIGWTGSAGGRTVNVDFLSNIGFMESLKVLSLNNCGLTGTIPAQGLCELRNLRELILRNNGLEGELHPWLASLTSLEFLDISSNEFSGNIGLSPLPHLTSLKYLLLSDNQLQVPISFGSFFNHSKLEYLESLNNELVVETKLQALISQAPSFQLLGLGLSNCKSCNLSTKESLFPNFLYHQHHLQALELSRINFNPTFLSWLLENNTRLEMIILSNNSLSGTLQIPLHPHPNLLGLDVSNNRLEGPIPNSIASSFPGLKYLNMSSNRLGGEIPASFGNMSFLEFLDLSNNRLSGEIPEQLGMDCLSLRLLKLSNNRMQGPILPRHSNLLNLEALNLDNNNFSEITSSLYASYRLAALNVSYNHLSGKIPGWSKLSSLYEIDMSNNHLEGPIPTQFCQLDQLLILDLSDNNISGMIPSCFNPPQLELLKLSTNRLQGSLSHVFLNSSGLRVLDLSHNQLSGTVPNWVGVLSHLKILLLKDNRLEGEIPMHLCQLSQLRMIDLSSNHFSGSIPPCFSNFTLEGFNESISGLIMGDLGTKYEVFSQLIPGQRGIGGYTGYLYTVIRLDPEAVFTTKGMSNSYKGIVLELFSGVDLSCNNLTGPIPPQIGNLAKIHMLNLSHNALTGPIPPTFSNLQNIESLDLSYNNLSGDIPLQLTQLYRLSRFNVSCNNLSGTIPEHGQIMAGQFGTFDESSYLGNPFLHRAHALSPPSINSSTENDDEGLSDMGIFYMSFAGSFVTAFFGVIVALWINLRWQQACFYYAEQFTTTCYYFVIDNFSKLFCRRRRNV